MNIYELLNSIVDLKQRISIIGDFPNEKKEELDTFEEKNLYDLIKNVCSMYMNLKDGGVEFGPNFIFDGKRSYSIEDITEEDYKLLATLDYPKLPVSVRARITDILWVQKKDYRCAIIAAESYYELFNLLFKDDDWGTALKMIKRAAQIARQINKKDVHKKCCETIYDHLIRIDGMDAQFLSISLMEFLMENSYGDENKILAIIDKILSLSQDDPYKMERAFELKFKYKNISGEQEEAKKVNIDLATYLADYAEKIYSTEQPGALQSKVFFQKAIFIYRNNGRTDLAEQTHRRLVEVQKDIYESMVFHNIPIGIYEIIEEINSFMVGLSFEKCVLRLTQLTHLFTKQEGEKTVIDDLNQHPFINLVKTDIINSDGQTLFCLEPLDISNPHKDTELLEAHINHKLYELEALAGNLSLGFAFNYIRERFDIKDQSLNFIFDNNAIIPTGRESIIEKGIRLAFDGDYYAAVHILAPQAENIFREIAKMAGALTVTLEKNGSSKQKTLSSVFELPELLECYDNDIIFLFKGLLNEQSGANIRNEIAHGIMDEKRCASGACIYFISALLKLLVISSPQCLKMLYEMKDDTDSKLRFNMIFGGYV